MSNESENKNDNKRIDLTQFEGKGILPLMVMPDTYTIAQDNNRIYEDEGYNYPEDDENRYGWIVGHIDSHYESDDPEYGIVQSERQEAMAKLFAMSPDLLAELKRCYGLIDRYDAAVRLLSEGESNVGCEGDLTVVNLSACHALYKLSQIEFEEEE